MPTGHLGLLRSFAGAIALLATGCGAGSERPAKLDGVYRVTTNVQDLVGIDAPREGADNPGTWTVVLARGRFALTREGDRACTWAYGALVLGKGNAMDWTVIDGGGGAQAAAANEPRDSYRFRWSRYRDVLTLSPANGGAAGYFAAKPWRRIAETPTTKLLSRRCPPPHGALEPTGAEHATPSPDARLRFVGDLVKTGPATWAGSATSAQFGRGRLTIEGKVAFSPPRTRTRVTFAARFAKGDLRGCSITAIVRRPHARYLWGSQGAQVTGTSPALHAYLGLAVELDGLTTTDHLDRMHGGFRSPPVHERRAAPRALC